MNIVHLPRRQSVRHWPLIAMINLQIEYTCEGRAHFLRTAGTALDNCSNLLAFARQAGLPIAHFRQVQPGQFFNPASKFSRWVEALTPRPSEYVFDHELPSAFSNAAFCNLMDHVEEPELVVAGFTGEFSCLSTAVDGYHRGIRTTFVTDCSASPKLGTLTEHEAHQAVSAVVANYADLTSLSELLLRLSSVAVSSV